MDMVGLDKLMNSVLNTLRQPAVANCRNFHLFKKILPISSQNSLRFPVFYLESKHRIRCLNSSSISPTKTLPDKDEPDLVKGKMYIEFTCKKCGHRNCKHFSKLAYDKGIVIIRCDGCENLHLIADNLGWIKNKKWKLEDVVKVGGKSVEDSNLP